MNQLPIWASIAQIAASILLGLAALVVGIASAVFAYRNNFGWKPIVLVTSHGLGSGFEHTHYDVTLKFEVWNRRKYPIVIRYMTVQFNTIAIEVGISTRAPSKGWSIFGGKSELHYVDEQSLAPSGREIFDVAAPFKKRPLDDLEDTVIICVVYYDPRANRSKTIRKKYRWHLRSASTRQRFFSSRFLARW